MKKALIILSIGFFLSPQSNAQFGKKLLQSVKDAANQENDNQQNTEKADNSAVSIESTNLSANYVGATQIDSPKRPFDMPIKDNLTVVRKGMLANKIEIINLNTNETVRKIEDIKAVFLGPILSKDSKLLAVGAFKLLKVINLSTNESFEIQDENLVKPAIYSEFTPNGKKILYISNDKKCSVYDLETKQKKDISLPLNIVVNAVSISENSNDFYIGLEKNNEQLKSSNKCDNGYKISMVTGETILKFEGCHKKDVFNTLIIDSLLLTAAADGYLALWNNKTGKLLFRTDKKDEESITLTIGNPEYYNKIYFNSSTNLLFCFRKYRTISIEVFSLNYENERGEYSGPALKLLETQYPPVGTLATTGLLGFESTNESDDIFFNFLNNHNSVLYFKEWFKNSQNKIELINCISKSGSFTSSKKYLSNILLYGILCVHNGELSKGFNLINLATNLSTTDYEKSVSAYIMACYYSIFGDMTNALSYLQKSFSLNKWNKEYVQKDTDLNLIKSTEESSKIINN